MKAVRLARVIAEPVNEVEAGTYHCTYCQQDYPRKVGGRRVRTCNNCLPEIKRVMMRVSSNNSYLKRKKREQLKSYAGSVIRME